MVEAESDEGRGASPAGKTASKQALPAPPSGRIGEVFKGLASVTREFEKCRYGSRVVERLIIYGMLCLIIVTYIKFGH